MTPATSVHLPKSVSTYLTITSDSVLTTGRCNKTSTPLVTFIVKPSLEGWPTKVEAVSSPHDVRLTLLDTNPVFQCLGAFKNLHKTFWGSTKKCSDKSLSYSFLFVRDRDGKVNIRMGGVLEFHLSSKKRWS